MIATIQHESKNLKIDLSKPLDISIPIKGNESNVNSWYVGHPKIEPEVLGEDTISVAKGAAVNFNGIYFNPHAHGTHTETVGHITEKPYSINKYLKQFFFLAEVISVAPERYLEDNIISLKQLEFALGNNTPDALLVRTMPNTKDKKSRQYSHTNWPYFTEEAIHFLVAKGIKHLMVDLPSIDREEDDGELKGHKTFWNIDGDIRKNATITELIYVPNKVKDGAYILNLQIAPFVNDATPSKPILYKILEQ